MLNEVFTTVDKISNLYKEILQEFKILRNQILIAKKDGITYNDIEAKIDELEQVKNELEIFLNKQ
jgi:hypothetical protein